MIQVWMLSSLNPSSYKIILDWNGLDWCGLDLSGLDLIRELDWIQIHVLLKCNIKMD